MTKSLKEEIDDIIYANFGEKIYWEERRDAVNSIYDVINDFLKKSCREFEKECTKVVETEVNKKLLERIETMRLIESPRRSGKGFEDGAHRQLDSDIRHLRGLDRQMQQDNYDDDWSF